MKDEPLLKSQWSPTAIVRDITRIKDLHTKAVKNLLQVTSGKIIKGEHKRISDLNESGSSIDDKQNDITKEITYIIEYEPQSLKQSIDEREIDIDKELDRKGTRLLHVATCLSSLQCVSVLLQSGATVNISLDSGETALYYALSSKNIEMVKILLEYYKKQKKTLSDYENLLMSNYVQSVDSAISIERKQECS